MQRGADIVAGMKGMPLVRTRLVRPGVASLHRAGILTPYLAEVIVEDMRRAGPHVRLEIQVGADCDAEAVSLVRQRFGSLGAVHVVQRRDRRARAVRPDAAA
jgi:hypothetical protein